jgi:hypothetical protein
MSVLSLSASGTADSFTSSSLRVSTQGLNYGDAELRMMADTDLAAGLNVPKSDMTTVCLGWCCPDRDHCAMWIEHAAPFLGAVLVRWPAVQGAYGCGMYEHAGYTPMMAVGE